MLISVFPADLSRLLGAVDQQRLLAILGGLPAVAHEPLLRCVHAAATFDSRPLPALIPLLGPTLRALPSQSCVVLLERIAQMAQAVPATVVPLFRSLGRVYDEVGAERTLAWIAAGAEVARRSPEAGTAFFALKSRTSLLTLRGASPAVYLSDIQGVLLKYVHMLSGAAIGLSETESLSFPPPLAERESEVVPLPFCIEQFPTYEENFRLYRVLVAHQVGRVEFGTYACSPSHLWSSLAPFVHALVGAEVAPVDDLVGYFRFFPRSDLIEGLFLNIEGKRIAARLSAVYPGLQPDLAWAAACPELAASESAALLARLADAAWVDAHGTETAADSLLLATKLYARFLHAVPKRSSETSSADESRNDFGGEAMAFLTGVELSGNRVDGSPTAEDQATRRRRPLTTTNLRYLYDEWDYEIEDYRPRWCELREVPLLGDEGAFFARTVATYAPLIPQIKQEFQRLRPRRYRQVKGVEEGEEIDLDSLVAARVDMLAGVAPSSKLYAARQLIERDVAVLFLLDVSASTAARVPGETTPGTLSAGRKDRRIIDVIKESVVLLAIALEEIGDMYAIYGFSSSGRYDVSVYPVKSFQEALATAIQGRIGGLTPRGSTRMGTAVRHATRKLKEVRSRVKLLVLLSDGDPEDTGYGKPVVPPRYGLRDTMMALREAERSGILSFCLTVDQGGHDYLREMCAPSRYLVIGDITTLPTELPKIYQRYIGTQWL